MPSLLEERMYHAMVVCPSGHLGDLSTLEGRLAEVAAPPWADVEDEEEPPIDGTCVDCGETGAGHIDETNINFYCLACWEQFHAADAAEALFWLGTASSLSQL